MTHEPTTPAGKAAGELNDAHIMDERFAKLGLKMSRPGGIPESDAALNRILPDDGSKDGVKMTIQQTSMAAVKQLIGKFQQLAGQADEIQVKMKVLTNQIEVHTEKLRKSSEINVVIDQKP